jgi:beta-glucosidase
MRFPAGFLFGASTSAHQIEGAVDEDGRGPSIWDTFAATPGAVTHGDTGTIACDHYHRVDADLDLAAAMGLTAYRFSLAWPRIIPDGTGSVNQKGLDFYRRMLDGLHARGIEPVATLYHWDLPQPLQDAGGWASRDTVPRFCDYAQVVLDNLGDLVSRWVTVNEPFCSAMIGHLEGRHAPGLRDLHAALAAGHHLLLAHGQAVQIVRASAPHAKVGISHLFSDLRPASPSAADEAATRRLDGYENRWFLDPVTTGSYPKDMVDWYQRQVPIDFIRDGDMHGLPGGQLLRDQGRDLRSGRALPPGPGAAQHRQADRRRTGRAPGRPGPHPAPRVQPGNRAAVHHRERRRLQRLRRP